MPHNCSDVWSRRGNRLYLTNKKSHVSKQSQVIAQWVIFAAGAICVREHSRKTPWKHSDSTNQVQAGELQSSTFIKTTSTGNRLCWDITEDLKATCSCLFACTAFTQVELFLSLMMGSKNLQICCTLATPILPEYPRFITLPGEK